MATPVKSLFLVLNPSSRSFSGQKKWPRIFELLDRSGVNYEQALTEKAGDGSRLAFAAAKRGFDAIIAVGGDGTINEVISGTAAALAAEPDNPCRFGVIYTGTSPDFCAFHNLSLDPDVIVGRILTGPTRHADICRIAHRASDSERQENRYFSCSANFGLGAAIARGSNSGLRQRFGDFIGTLLSMLTAIKNYSPRQFRLKIDGVERNFDQVHNIFIGKNPYVASGIRLKLDISADDGRMYLVALHGISRFRLLSILPRVYTGSFCNEFKPIFCRSVEIFDGGGADEVEYDGDPQGRLPARIEILPRRLPLIGG
ncbi:MAG: hypothetical protein CVV42_13745 [Candidatus Riflebacteria bacterium HGW-Riflebacteria-2]|nr:MAG: hypothetical protein CVV42_13745 [Candidatus Riflebacteria bacterium HGW-Riflebacteria-2]